MDPMDSLTADSCSAYSDPSTPRTPSPTALIQYPAVYGSDYKGSLLNELYDQEMPPEYQQLDWQLPPPDYPIRRASFPYVRHDQRYPMYEQDQHCSWRQEPYPPYHDFHDPSIKLEDNSPIMVQHQSNFYRSPPSCHQIPMPYLPPPPNNLTIQHTDDAASKETQYLRRRCFNCHTTEPPSWRRSTLNPGKIVCNKCGLYERTHLRPRPLRFDELRSRSKCRKPSKPITSPKQSKIAMIKKESVDFGYDRRSSVSSASSVHSVYSRDSHSPTQDNGIRLPSNPLSDVESMIHATPTNCILPQSIARKSHSTSASFHSPSYSETSLICQGPDYYPHSQNSASPEGALWVECTEMNSPGSVSSPSGSLWREKRLLKNNYFLFIYSVWISPPCSYPIPKSNSELHIELKLYPFPSPSQSFPPFFPSLSLLLEIYQPLFMSSHAPFHSFIVSYFSLEAKPPHLLPILLYFIYYTPSTSSWLFHDRSIHYYPRPHTHLFLLPFSPFFFLFDYISFLPISLIARSFTTVVKWSLLCTLLVHYTGLWFFFSFGF